MLNRIKSTFIILSLFIPFSLVYAEYDIYNELQADPVTSTQVCTVSSACNYFSGQTGNWTNYTSNSSYCTYPFYDTCYYDTDGDNYHTNSTTIASCGGYNETATSSWNGYMHCIRLKVRK